MDANRMQLAAALKASGNSQGGQMAQQGYAQRPGVPTRQGMPQDMLAGQASEQGFNAPPQGMQQLPPQAMQQGLPPQAMAAMRAAPQFGGINPAAPAPGGKPSMGAGRPMPRPMR